jgi:hypothetical protein
MRRTVEKGMGKGKKKKEMLGLSEPVLDVGVVLVDVLDQDFQMLALGIDPFLFLLTLVLVALGRLGLLQLL